MFQTITYVSTCNPDMTTCDINDLFNFVKEENNKNNISGILMYSDGNFFQVIEGEQEVLYDLFENIKKDKKHRDIIKIFDRKITSKAFLKYDSSFATSTSEPYKSLELKNFLFEEERRNPEHYKSIYYLARKFLNLT